MTHGHEVLKATLCNQHATLMDANEDNKAYIGVMCSLLPNRSIKRAE